MLRIGDVAVNSVVSYLESMDETIKVVSVEDDKNYQERDIDLLWHFKTTTGHRCLKVEVKGDRYSHTGNIFLETVSNMQLNKKGCFLYSEADYFFYYFIDSGDLYIIPLQRARSWFRNNQYRFLKRSLSTAVGNGKKYSSLGYLVPRRILMREVDGVIHRRLPVT